MLDSIVDPVARARELVASGDRVILGITGPPGAGKSTLAAALVAAIGESAAAVGMDGFHLSNAELLRLGRRGRKGAPDTFDVGGYVALLQRLRARDEDVVYAPEFVRALEEPIGSAVPVPKSVTLVVTEGNYLLVDHGGWERVRGVLDAVWFLDVAPAARDARLLERRRRHGSSVVDAISWIDTVDRPNSILVDETRSRADAVVSAANVRTR